MSPAVTSSRRKTPVTTLQVVVSPEERDLARLVAAERNESTSALCRRILVPALRRLERRSAR